MVRVVAAFRLSTNRRELHLLREGGLAVEAAEVSAFGALVRAAAWRSGFDAVLLSPRLPAGELPQLLRAWRGAGGRRRYWR